MPKHPFEDGLPVELLEQLDRMYRPLAQEAKDNATAVRLDGRAATHMVGLLDEIQRLRTRHIDKDAVLERAKIVVRAEALADPELARVLDHEYASGLLYAGVLYGAGAAIEELTGGAK